MTYGDLVEMSNSPSLRSRVTAAVASEGQENPDQWVSIHWWSLCTQPGWADAWSSARANYNPDYNPDPGARPSVITDAMILAAVQGLREEQQARVRHP